MKYNLTLIKCYIIPVLSAYQRGRGVYLHLYPGAGLHFERRFILGGAWCLMYSRNRFMKMEIGKKCVLTILRKRSKITAGRDDAFSGAFPLYSLS